VVAIADTAFLHFTANMKQGAFDMMVRYRLAVPKPDKDIVIVDINEASLAAMSKEYGRWPWPRQVLGEFVEQIEKQHPQAVVFDILFSDPEFSMRTAMRISMMLSRDEQHFFFRCCGWIPPTIN